jgi:hypothetical protein
MRKNRGILKDLKAVTCNDMLTTLKTVDQDLLKAADFGREVPGLLLHERHGRRHPRLHQGRDRRLRAETVRGRRRDPAQTARRPAGQPELVQAWPFAFSPLPLCP